MTLIARIYFLIFWIPAVTSAVMLTVSWSSGMLSRPLPPLVWFAAGLLLQVLTRQLSPLWTIGLVLQSALSIGLLIKWKLDS